MIDALLKLKDGSDLDYSREKDHGAPEL